MYFDTSDRSTDEYLYSFSPGSFSCRTYMVATEVVSEALRNSKDGRIRSCSRCAAKGDAVEQIAKRGQSVADFCDRGRLDAY